MACDSCETMSHCLKNGCVPKVSPVLYAVYYRDGGAWFFLKAFEEVGKADSCVEVNLFYHPVMKIVAYVPSSPGDAYEPK